MMIPLKWVFGLLVLIHPTYGFIGMSISMYKPPCAYSCWNMISSAMLDCPNATEEGGHHDGMVMRSLSSPLPPIFSTSPSPSVLMKRHGGHDSATPECRAGNLPFLSTLAYCISQQCPTSSVSESTINKFWESSAASGSPYEPVIPHYTFTQALKSVNGTPTEVFDDDVILNITVLVDRQKWKVDCLTIDNFAHGEALHARYAVILLVVGVGIPILATLLTLTCPNFTLKLKPYLVYPIIYRHHIPILHWFHLPNLGQTTYITLFFILNIILSSVGYSSVQPSTWYSTTKQEITSKIAARTGIIAMALAPLTFLFAGRNNILLYMTNWDHGTYILLHRWIARFFTVHVIIHSIGELWAYVDMGMYESELVLPYWIWGCVATVACVAMCIKSIFRVWKYEIFLLLHIILAVFVLVGTWYHLIYRFEYRWGYHWMLYACFAVWGFDRLLRVFLILHNGRHGAVLTKLGDNIVRVDIRCVRMDSPGTHGYVYYPNVRRWAPWESHPFSVVPTRLLAPAVHTPSASSPSSDNGSTENLNKEKDLEQPPAALPPILMSHYLPLGVTFYVKAHSGLTRQLATMAERGEDSTKSLVEGPYGHRTMPKADRLILIAGGVGITAVLPFWANHRHSKLYWSTKSNMQAMVDDLNRTALFQSNKEKEVRIGGRFDVKEVLEIEANHEGILGVIVCGPKGICEEVRKAVVEVGRGGKKIEFRCEAFSW